MSRSRKAAGASGTPVLPRGYKHGQRAGGDCTRLLTIVPRNPRQSWQPERHPLVLIVCGHRIAALHGYLSCASPMLATALQLPAPGQRPIRMRISRAFSRSSATQRRTSAEAVSAAECLFQPRTYTPTNILIRPEVRIDSIRRAPRTTA